MKTQFSASLMCMDFLQLEKQIRILNERVDMLHVDIMDGHFCKNITLSPDMVRTFARVARKPMDCHLMTTNPEDWIERLGAAGAAYISFHGETVNVNAFRVISQIEEMGCKVGLVLNPATPLEMARHYLNRVELLTIMTVEVGYSGQPLVEESLDKIREAVEWREKYGYTYQIQVDGSCNQRNYRRLYEAGAEILVMGNTGLFGMDADLNRACDLMYENFARETT